MSEQKSLKTDLSNCIIDIANNTNDTRISMVIYKQTNIYSTLQCCNNTAIKWVKRKFEKYICRKEIDLLERRFDKAQIEREREISDLERDVHDIVASLEGIKDQLQKVRSTNSLKSFQI